MLNICQFSSLMAAAEGPVAEFSSFANLEEKKRKSNLLMSFPKTGNQMGSFGEIRKNSFFRFCRPILDIFGLTLLMDNNYFFFDWKKNILKLYNLDDLGRYFTEIDKCRQHIANSK